MNSFAVLKLFSFLLQWKRNFFSYLPVPCDAEDLRKQFFSRPTNLKSFFNIAICYRANG